MRSRRPRYSPVPESLVLELVKRSDGRCEFPGCREKATDFHHRQLRSQGGKNELANLLALDRAHHRWVHDNPAESYERGLLVKSWQDPREVEIA